MKKDRGQFKMIFLALVMAMLVLAVIVTILSDAFTLLTPDSSTNIKPRPKNPSQQINEKTKIPAKAQYCFDLQLLNLPKPHADVFDSCNIEEKQPFVSCCFQTESEESRAITFLEYDENSNAGLNGLIKQIKYLTCTQLDSPGNQFEFSLAPEDFLGENIVCELKHG